MNMERDLSDEARNAELDLADIRAKLLSLDPGVTEHESKAYERLREDLERIFADVDLVPQLRISTVDSFNMCEDGRTFMLMCRMADGWTMIVQACPGERLSVHIQ